MPTTIVKYQCDICGEKYDSLEKATSCEAQGWFDPKFYPAGLMWEYYHHGFVGIFALPETATPDTHGWNKGHIGKPETGLWACRATQVGDSLGDERCGGNDYYRSDPESLKRFKEYHKIDKHLDGPEFKRMVKYLRSKGITPSYYNMDGELIIMKEV